MERAQLKEVVRSIGGCAERGQFTFLCDPAWGGKERTAFAALASTAVDAADDPSKGWLCIPTGGTGGALRFARHDEHSLGSAVEGFCRHFEIRRVNAVGVLPPFHVSGLMPRVRSAVTGGEHVAWDWRRLENGLRPEFHGDDWVISLVPTQLARLLESPAASDWLRRFRVVFLGGAPVWAELAERAAAARLPVSLSYGMTETAAMVCALRPEEFLTGDRSSGAAMPHTRIGISDDGLIRIESPALFLGYFPRRRPAGKFETEDLGRLDERGHLHVLGRRDAVIISGGEKINPAEVESVLRGTGAFSDIAVIGVPDPDWGERVVACYLKTGSTFTADVVQRVKSQLSRHKQPKQYLAVPGESWIRTMQDKVNRAELRELAIRLTLASSPDPAG